MHGAHSSATGEPSRPHTRYSLATTVEIRASGLPGTVLAQLSNISLSGCYVSTPQKLAEHTRVRIVLHSGSLKAELWGIIQRQDRDGLGIRFSNGTTVEDWKALESIIEHLQTKKQATSAGY
ncbi:MAG TPA: PilZ domain-containing protein [Terriglobales bacterium]|nr:PilZ domain-containing protein [Terriglobales bacterium]